MHGGPKTLTLFEGSIKEQRRGIKVGSIDKVSINRLELNSDRSIFTNQNPPFPQPSSCDCDFVVSFASLVTTVNRLVCSTFESNPPGGARTRFPGSRPGLQGSDPSALNLNRCPKSCLEVIRSPVLTPFDDRKKMIAKHGR